MLNGKGLWAYRETELDRAIQIAPQAGATHILYKVGQGSEYYPGRAQIAQKITGAGLIPFAWTWVLLDESVSGLLNRYRVLAHRLEQSGLCSWCSPVDFIGEDDVREEGARKEFEFPALLAIHRYSDDVRGQCVGGELNAMKIEIQRPCEGLCEGRLSHTGDVLEENMSSGEERCDQRIDDLLLAANHPHDGCMQTLQTFEDGIGHWIQGISIRKAALPPFLPVYGR